MDYRILVAAVAGLVLLAFGGFFFALSQLSRQVLAPPAEPAAASAGAINPAAPVAKASPASIEAEIARSDHAELQSLLKKHFGGEYDELIAIAVRRRNEGVSDLEFGQEILDRFQEIMRSKLKFAVGASTSTIDQLAEIEIGLFRALGTEAAPHCLKVLGKDDTKIESPLPESVKRAMRMGTLIRFHAIVEGMPKSISLEPLSADEMAAFEKALGRHGLQFEEVRSGAFLDKEGAGPGKPCLMVEKLYQSIARLGEGARRKLYTGLFFLGRGN